MYKSVPLLCCLLSLSLTPAIAADKQDASPALDPTAAREMVRASIQSFPLADGVSIDDAVASMKLRANMLNFKMVADLPLSEQVQALGEDSRPMRILGFCDALIAKQMVEFDIIFAGFLPCRIAVVEDKDGQGWIVTTNMDMMMHAVDLPDDLKPMAQKVRDSIYSIVDAGVNGDL